MMAEKNAASQAQVGPRKNPASSAAASIRSARGGGHGGPPFARPVEKPKDFKGTMKKLLAFARPYAPQIAVICLFAIISTVFTVIGPLVMGSATTELFNGAVAKVNGTGSINFAEIGRILLIVLALYAASGLSSFAQSWIAAGVSQRITFKLRESIDKKINRLPLAYFEKTTVGDTLSRITNDVDTLGSSLSSSITQIITTVVTVFGIIAVMLSVNVIMTLVVILIGPLGFVCVAVIVKLSQKHYIRQQRQLGAVNARIEETFSGHAEVKAFHHESKSLAAFMEENDRLFDAAWKSQFMSSFMKPIMDIVGNIGYVAVAVVGALLAARGAITVGHIQAFIQYQKNFMQPITALAQIANVLQSMVAAAERIFEVLDAEEEQQEPDTVRFPEDGEIVFSHVRFGYDPEKPVIKDFNARVAPGQTVAIVGPTGAGKTTMVKLLMRFYDVQGGTITIGGVDIRRIPRNELREHFGMVLQETWLFSGTVRDNIRYGRLDATDDEVVEAAKAAKTNRFIRTLPGAYDFPIGEDGGNVSQGQRQLLTIARAFLADRQMLILDEATSSVDTRTEARIQRAMDNLMANRTCFVIAHRLSTIKNADLILVMKDGDIIEQGTHDELIAREGFYADLYNAQFIRG